MRDFKLYVILDAGILRKYDALAEIARQAISGEADILQLRAKSLTDREILKIGRVIKSLAKGTKAAFVLNDRVDLAQIIDADGVHLGRQDLSVKDARKILGENKIIGLSTHSVEEACGAEREGADYIAIGPVFATATKPAATALGPEIIARIKDKVRVPFVAVGGINLGNLEQVLACGAQRVAVCRAIITAKDACAAAKEFRRRLYR